jgi:hypothetical protein
VRQHCAESLARKTRNLRPLRVAGRHNASRHSAHNSADGQTPASTARSLCQPGSTIGHDQHWRAEPVGDQVAPERLLILEGLAHPQAHR